MLQENNQSFYPGEKNEKFGDEQETRVLLNTHTHLKVAYSLDEPGHLWEATPP